MRTETDIFISVLISIGTIPILQIESSENLQNSLDRTFQISKLKEKLLIRKSLGIF